MFTNTTTVNSRGRGTDISQIFLPRPFYLSPQSEQIVFGKVCCGTRDEVESLLERFDPQNGSNRAVLKSFRDKRIVFDNDNPYSFALERLAATSLTNVVYPVRIQGDWIRHHTPGRWWDSLYTWDSGFIGLGFAVLDIKRAVENLNTYLLTLPGNSQSAFIHHGSPVATQFFLFQEIFNRTGSMDFLKEFYPQMLQYHRFMTGRMGSSTTGKLKSGLLKTWDYFYSAGGWDDYPPQVYIRNNSLESSVAPVITSAMGIRTALILKGAAAILGEDTDELDKDIRKLKSALQDHSWTGNPVILPQFAMTKTERRTTYCGRAAAPISIWVSTEFIRSTQGFVMKSSWMQFWRKCFHRIIYGRTTD